ncbi:hypothetical protein [uncultured Stenotrophomonas sp.]|uniref:hypothetical protein n=1 Tax=uncultured Stenotrophomonas sp. TaxID=165438 RepID=UPI0025ECA81A|nr:hypothetical protein [uncultured Stenotrophomonas sp.]
MQTPPSGHAILVSGPWGSGKSYQWDRLARTLDATELQPITLSVAGLTTQEQLEGALLQASVSGLGSEVMREVATIVGRALLRTIKIDPADIKLKTEFLSGKTVVCLDDVERFGGDFSVLFGFIVYLLDRGKIHCVLLADEDRAKEKFTPDFGKYKERIVGRTVTITPDVAAFCTQTINGLGDPIAREWLSRHRQYIEELMAQCGVSNLRTVRYFITEAASLISDMRPIEQSDIRPLLSAACFWIVSTSRDASQRETAATAFRIGGMSLAIQMHLNRSGGSSGGDDVVNRASKLVQEYGLEAQAATWPQSAAFAAMVKGREVDMALIAEDFSLHAYESGSKAREVQLQLSGYRQMTDPELQSAIYEAITVLEIGVEGDLVELLELYRTLRHFRQLGFIAQSEENYEHMMRTAFSSYDPTRLTCDKATLEFMLEHQDATSLPIWSIVDTLSKAIEAREDSARKEEFLAQLVDPTVPVPGLIESRGLFDGLDPQTYATELIARAPISTERLSKAIQKSYQVSNVKSFLEKDANFYDSVARILRKDLKLDVPRTIAQVSVLSVADQLSSLADKVR